MTSIMLALASGLTYPSILRGVLLPRTWPLNMCMQSCHGNGTLVRMFMLDCLAYFQGVLGCMLCVMGTSKQRSAILIFDCDIILLLHFCLSFSLGWKRHFVLADHGFVS